MPLNLPNKQVLAGWQRLADARGVPLQTIIDENSKPGVFGKIGGIALPAFFAAAGIPLPPGLFSSNNSGGNKMPISTGNFTNAANNSGLLGDRGGLSNIPSWLNDLLKNFPNINIGSNNNTPTPNTNSNANNNNLNWLLPILAGLAGGLENRSGKSSTTSTLGPVTETNNVGASTTTRTPNYDPKAQGYRDQLIDAFTQNMNQDPDLRGYESNQLIKMGRTGQNNEQQLRDTLVSRGITGPALENALAGSRANTFSETTQFRNQIPLLARDLRQQALTSAGSFFGTIPYGNTENNSGRTDVTTNSGQTNTTSTEESGNILGGGLSSFVAMLARLYGMGGFQRQGA